MAKKKHLEVQMALNIKASVKAVIRNMTDEQRQRWAQDEGTDIEDFDDFTEDGLVRLLVFEMEGFEQGNKLF